MDRSDFWHFTPFRVRYYEADAQGILFNANYLAYFDTCIVEYLRDLPFDWIDEKAKHNTDFHTVRALVEYATPVRYDEEIEIGTKIEKLGRSSMTFKFAIFGKGESNVRSTGGGCVGECGSGCAQVRAAAHRIARARREERKISRAGLAQHEKPREGLFAGPADLLFSRKRRPSTGAHRVRRPHECGKCRDRARCRWTAVR